MSERSQYDPGTPCWVDLATPDPEQSVAFYRDLLGWGSTDPGPAEADGGYRMFTMRDKAVAGLMPIRTPGWPAAWSSYIATDDADATAASVTRAGGRTLAPPMDVSERGRMAYFTDPAGAPFGVWQAGTFHGSELVNEAGALGWNELATSDPAGARDFYGAVFGWSGDARELDDAPYTEWMLAGHGVGGMFELDPAKPGEDGPAHWLPYFAVDDVHVVAQRAPELGGAVIVAPRDIAVGRYAVLADLHGARFAVITPPTPTGT